MNPTVGAALEAAREAEAALLALEQRAREQRASDGDPDSGGESEEQNADSKPGTGPVHRVEIEAAEVVPSHSGRATKGFVARVHRMACPGASDGGNTNTGRDSLTSRPETHVFSDHRDLVSFLGDELGKGQ